MIFQPVAQLLHLLSYPCSGLKCEGINELNGKKLSGVEKYRESENLNIINREFQHSDTNLK